MAVHALTHSFNTLRGDVTNTKYSDLELRTESGEAVLCHKVILSSVSNRVKSSLDKRESSKIVIRSVKIGGLKSVIDFIYNGRIEFEDSTELMDFVDAFALLQVNMGSKIAKTIENMSMNFTDSSEDLSQNPLIKCENCEKIFKEKRQLSRHVRQVHEKKQANKLIKKSFACEQCGAIYTSLRQVQYCKCKTRKRSRGKDPEKDPYDRCVYQCQVCSRKYGDRRVLRNHIIQLHKTSYQDYLQQFGDPTVECPKWSCPLCKSTMKFFRNSIETHLNQQHTLSLEEFELEHGRPKHPSDPSSIPPSNSVSIQSSGQHPHHDEAPSAEYRSPLPSTSAQSLAESYRKLATANSWLPVPQLNHRVSSAITPLRHGHGVISAKRSVPLPCVSGEPPSDKSGGEINTEAVPGRPHSSVSVADEADSLPMDFSDVEETFPSSLEML